MVTIKWCITQKKGIEITEPNRNTSDSYVKMAEESINILSKLQESNIWTATTSYYIFYYSLYSVMLRIGIKCEIHACSIEFMKQFLKGYYDAKDAEMFEAAFSNRIDLQYYADRPVDKKSVDECKKYCKYFFVKTKDILAKLTEKQILEIRTKLKEHQK